MDRKRRYIRQTMLPHFGERGQEALAGASVLVVGAGGLGSPLLTYLAAAGVGRIGIAEHDRVEPSNLPRQILFEEGDIHRPKLDAAIDRLSELNSATEIVAHQNGIRHADAASIIGAYDVVADGCDNFATRLLVNTTCVALQKPLVSASVAGWHGQLASFDVARGTPCYQCLVHPDATDANTCEDSGIIGPLAGIIGSMQALEVLRVIIGEPALLGTLALYDGRTHAQRMVRIGRDAHCAVCK
jgi:molybdopterin/thiamine biosynthesis adenylyltransferase